MGNVGGVVPPGEQEEGVQDGQAAQKDHGQEGAREGQGAAVLRLHRLQMLWQGGRHKEGGEKHTNNSTFSRAQCSTPCTNQ